MKPQVTIIDYGMGNFYSVARAFEVCGANVITASVPEQIAAAEYLVLPGVGAFESAMAGLRERNLVEPIRSHAAAGKPLLGICLGMQMFATVSKEFGEHEGLDLIPGRVLPLPQTTVQGNAQKVPYIGWANLYKSPGADWQKSVFGALRESDAVYLVHSFAVTTDDPAHRLAYIQFGGHQVCAAIRRGSVIGCQFHPEKSGAVGLNILAKFLADKKLLC